MRHGKFLVIFLAFGLFAADPFVGTWKLNLRKSNYKTGAPPKEQTMTFSEEGSDLHLVATGTVVTGQPISNNYTVPVAGGAGKIIESPFDAVSSRNVGPRERDVMFSKGGKLVYTGRAKLSRNGKSLTVTFKGTNPLGQTIDGTSYYDRQ